ncbi:MAG: prolyl oligopeptidase family serine peptidase [Planctomycetaceae bacterium]|nr:prolyl oligopeptidase family serine peptidase [Planctomycetales bacterium]MCB9922105.1 prolyl oligopeptidase family serine peptidase [Planctomycetaceae bacterium]
MKNSRLLASFQFLSVLVATCAASSEGSERFKIDVKSSIDQTDQPSYVNLPDNFDPNGQSVPLLVSLHSWSGDLEQRNEPLERLANERGWIVLQPNFRGRNDHPEACGSEIAQQDILDVIEWVKSKYPIDGSRIYLSGNSGGGHMTMMMVGRHPEVWAAASAWVGISDLAAWYDKHSADGDRYGQMMRKVCGGKPGDSPTVDQQYERRSPLTYLHRAVGVPLDIAAGVHDGYTGSVPTRHSLEAFNVIARADGSATITEAEIQQIGRPEGRLDAPRPSDQVADASFGREIYLRRMAKHARVTIFEGGHEGIASAAISWLEQHAKQN